MEDKPLKYNKGDLLVYKGSGESYYGCNLRADKFIGQIVTIVDTYYNPDAPNAYLFGEFDERFWFDENCFEFSVKELPEFDPGQPLDMLLL